VRAADIDLSAFIGNNNGWLTTTKEHDVGRQGTTT
jgi:hypothetical protein